MKLGRASAALAAIALLLSNLRASAQTPSPSSDEPEERAPPERAAPLTTAPPSEKPPSEKAPPPEKAAPDVDFAPPPPLRVENASASIQFGILAQPQFEMAGAPDADSTTKSLLLRRIRFMVGRTLFRDFDYFFDIDYPDLFKVDPTNQSGGTGKNAPGLNAQDAFVTFIPVGDLFKVDTGFMLSPLSPP